MPAAQSRRQVAQPQPDRGQCPTEDASSLPPTNPASTPQVIGEVAVSASTPTLRWTPAMASAKSGTMTKAVQGW